MVKHDLLRFAGKLASFTFVLIWAGNVTAADRPPVEECMRCHDVKQYQYELKNSVHAFDKDKKIINCEQCHVFHFSPLTSYYARDEYYDKKYLNPVPLIGAECRQMPGRRISLQNARNVIKISCWMPREKSLFL